MKNQLLAVGIMDHPNIHGLDDARRTFAGFPVSILPEVGDARQHTFAVVSFLTGRGFAERLDIVQRDNPRIAVTGIGNEIAGLGLVFRFFQDTPPGFDDIARLKYMGMPEDFTADRSFHREHCF